jgi:AcrR family transcriptional regulator
MVSPAPTSKPLRCDAQRNRDHLVTTARELFATVGVDASVEEVTRRAGVGMGTLYRHFPTKEELIDAVLEDAFRQYIGIAEAALAHADAWGGLCHFLDGALALQSANHALMEVAGTREHGRARAANMRRQLRPLLVTLVERAHDQGSLREDIVTEDLALLLWGGHGVIERGGAVAPEIWRRYLGVVLDGMRAPAATPLPHPPLSRSQADRAKRYTR